ARTGATPRRLALRGGRLVGGARLLAAAKQRVAAEGDDRQWPGAAHASVATRMALIVCRRFSAWSKTMLAGERKTSSVTSSPPLIPVASAISAPTVVFAS